MPTSEEVRQSWVDAYDKALATIMDGEWSVGGNDRGHGHCSYAVIMATNQDQKALFKPFLECPCIEIAEHIVDMHNAARKAKQENEHENDQD